MTASAAGSSDDSLRDRAVEIVTAPEIPSRAQMWERLAAEALGTFVLVLGGCGSAVIAGAYTTPTGQLLGIGYLGVALAFGLTVLTMAVAVGGISGGHFNPAVTLGLFVAGRIERRFVLPYILAQLVAATIAGAVLFVIAAGKAGFNATQSGFASNGYGVRSPGEYNLGAVLLTEIVLTAVFLAVIIAATGEQANAAIAPIAIGFTLTLIHLISIPVDNTSVNPARSLGVAWFAGPDALAQVWVFILAPIIGAVLAGGLFRTATGLRHGLGGQGKGAVQL